MMLAARAHARWEIETAKTILGDKKRIFILCLLMIPIFAVTLAFAGPLADAAPEILGGKKAYSPAYYSTGIFVASILIGLCAGLITGCIGAGGGFIIAPVASESSFGLMAPFPYAAAAINNVAAITAIIVFIRCLRVRR